MNVPWGPAEQRFYTTAVVALCTANRAMIEMHGHGVDLPCNFDREGIDSFITFITTENGNLNCDLAASWVHPMYTDANDAPPRDGPNFAA
jgi:hypothetical protein